MVRRSQYGGYGGYGRYGGGYMNTQMRPTTTQYESFFNPIPIEFLQQQFDRRQNRYDQAYAGALAGRDELTNIQVGLADMSDKNSIIKGAIDDIDKTVEEKFGGDWGAAAKNVASKISKARANPFWNAQNQAQKQRQIAQKLKVKYGPNAMIFNDSTNLSVLDEQGNVRDISQLQPDIVEKGDWLKTARELMAGLTPDQNPYGLTKGEIDNFVKYGVVKEITKDKIKRFTEDENIQNALLTRHPEIARGFKEGDERMKSQFGFDTDPQDFARRQLLGAASSAEMRQKTASYTTDPISVARNKAALEGTGGQEPRENVDDIIYNRYVEDNNVINQDNFNQEGKIKTAEERRRNRSEEPNLKSYEPLLKSYGLDPTVLLARGWDAAQKIYQKKQDILPVPLTIPGVMLKSNQLALDFVRRLAVKDQELKIKALREKYPYLEGTDAEVNSLVATAQKDLGQMAKTTYDYGDDWREAETENILHDSETGGRGRIFDGEVHIDGELISGTNKERNIARALGFNNTSEEFNETIDKATISGMSFTGSTPGEYLVRVVGKDGKTKQLEISPPDRKIQQIATPAWIIAQNIKSGGQMEIPDYTVSVKFSDGSVSPSQKAVRHGDDLIVPSTKGIDTTGDGKVDTQTWYYVEDKIVPIDDSNKEGRHATRIHRVLYDPSTGEIQVLQGGPMGFKDVINETKKSIENSRYLKTMRNKEQVNG